MNAMTASDPTIRTTLTRRQLHRFCAASNGWAVADWPALGTTAQVIVADPRFLGAATVAVGDSLRRIDLAASRFRPDSELSELNRRAGEWVAISPLLAQALRISLDAAAWTEGAIDPTVGAALIDLGYDRTFTLVPPVGPEIELRARDIRGWRNVELDDESSAGARARVPEGTMLDLGATAKALAADLAACAAADACGASVLVNLGGDIAVAGASPTGGWPIAIADVADIDAEVDVEVDVDVTGETAERDADDVVTIRAGGLATSSVSARRWQRGGSVIHHLIDPSRGLPATTPWRTVSVAARTCAMANAASTAAVIMGARAPQWLADRGLPARLVGHGGGVVYVGGWPPVARRPRNAS